MRPVTLISLCFALASGRPIAIGEMGAQARALLEALPNQPRWAWFMGRADIFNRGKAEAVPALFNEARVLSRGDSLTKE